MKFDPEDFKHASERAKATKEQLDKLNGVSTDAYQTLRERYEYLKSLADDKDSQERAHQELAKAREDEKKDALRIAIEQAKAKYESLGIKYKLECFAKGNFPRFDNLKEISDVEALMDRFDEYVKEQESKHQKRKPSEPKSNDYREVDTMPTYKNDFMKSSKERAIDAAKMRWEGYSSLKKLQYIMKYGKPNFETLCENLHPYEINDLFTQSKQESIYEGDSRHSEAFNNAQLRWMSSSSLKKAQYIITHMKSDIMRYGKPRWGTISNLSTEELNGLFQDGGKQRG